MKIFSILALTLMSLGISAADLPPSTRWQPLHFTDGQAYFVDDSFASNRAGWLLTFSRTDSGSWQDEAPLVSRLELDCENHQFRAADHHFFDDASERFQLETDGVWRDVTRRSVIGIAFNKSCETTASFAQAISLDFQESERLAATSDQLFRVSTVWTAIAEAENSIGFAARASAGTL